MQHPSADLVATGHPETSAAAAGALRRGGNAFDAALAAGFAASVVEPMFTSLGGGGFLLARTAAGREVLYDFFVDTPGRGLSAAERETHFLPMTVNFPASQQVFNIGRGAVAVPGTLRGLLHVHERLGSLPLAEIVAPAARLARLGVVLNAHQAYVQELLLPILTLSEAGRAIYTPEGRGLREGERLLNRDLADFLDVLPQDRGREFYEGALAQRISAEMRAGQGLLGAADLAAYRVEEREPLAFHYRGWRVLTNPPPSTGGALVARALSRLEKRDFARCAWGSAGHLVALAEVMQEVERLRLRPATGGTTHVSICDAAGNAASLSLSNGEGAGYVAPGTGIMLNNMLGEDDLHPEGFHASPPGRRVGSMMSPAIVMQDGGPILVAGSGGSKRIRSAMLQVITGVLDFELGVREAVEAPRLHWDGELLQLEPGFEEASVEALRSRWPLNRWPERNLYFGGVHAVTRSADAGSAAGDPRRSGHALVVRR